MTLTAARTASTPPGATIVLALAAALALAWPGVAAAEEAPARPQGPVETVEVRDRSDETAALDPTAFATVIRAEDFAGRITTVEDLLRESVGVQVKSLGGEFATVSIRGSSAEQVIVYLDGVPLNRALGGGVNLADLPLGQVESIEIYRGFTPAALPAASIGGAVVVRTRRAGRGPAGGGRVSYGSFVTAEAAAHLSGSRGRSDYALGADATSSRGDFLHADNNGTEFEASDDTVTRRVNNDFRRTHVSGRWSLRAGERARVGLSTDLLSRDQGVPGKDANPSRTARLDDSRVLLRSDVEVPGLLGGRLLVRGAADYTLSSEAFDDSRDSVGLGGGGKCDNRIASFGQEAGLVLAAARHQAISLLASHRRETADLERRLRIGDPSDLGRVSRDTLVTTVEDQVSLAGDRVVLNPSARHERATSTFRAGPAAGLVPDSPREVQEHTTGKVGVLVRATERLAVKGNFGRFVRLPDFTELFGNRGSVRGNPALRPERGRSADLGLTVSWRSGAFLRQARLEGTVFETLAEDLILFVGTSPGTVLAQNVGRARVRGVELSLALGLGARFSGSLNVTHQRAVNRSGGTADGKLLPGRPGDEASATAALALGRGQVYYGFTYVGRNFVDYLNTESRGLPARHLHDLGYRLSLPHGLKATLEIENLTDDRTFDVASFPLPGRSVHGRLAWEF